MADDYLPASDFLRLLIDDQVALTGSEFAGNNLQRLIALTRDADVSNRDWATLLLAQTGLDSPAIRSAFLDAAQDVDVAVRGEAILGLALLDREVALPLVLAGLSTDEISVPLLEAAEQCADASLVPALKGWADRIEDSYVASVAIRALARCSGQDQAGC